VVNERSDYKGSQTSGNLKAECNMSRLERAAYILMCIACIVSVATIVERRIRSPYPQTTSENSLTGQTINNLDVNWRESNINVVLFLNSHCRYCTDSSPFYRQLAALEREAHGRFSIIAASVEEVSATKEYLARNKIRIDRTIKVPGSIPGVAGTPTLLLVDSEGVIHKSFFGRLTADGEARVRALIGKGTL